MGGCWHLVRGHNELGGGVIQCSAFLTYHPHKNMELERETDRERQCKRRVECMRCKCSGSSPPSELNEFMYEYKSITVNINISGKSIYMC